MLAAVELLHVLIPATFYVFGIGSGWLLKSHFYDKAAKDAAAKEAEHWRQALRHVLDVTDEVDRQSRDNWKKGTMRPKAKRASDALEQLLREHAGPLVALHVEALKAVNDHLLALNGLYSGSLTEDRKRQIVESAASLAQEVEALRAALE